MVAKVTVTSRTASSLTLSWDRQADRSWTYILDINGTSHSVTGRYPSDTFTINDLEPGTKYLFSVTTEFSGLRSTPYEGNTVTSASTTIWWKHLVVSIQNLSMSICHSPTRLDARSLKYILELKIPQWVPPLSVFFLIAIDCASGTWNVTTSSIDGEVKGLFTSAEATNDSLSSLKQNNLSFTDLFPGATYEIVLLLEHGSEHLEQCRHFVTICEY